MKFGCKVVQDFAHQFNIKWKCTPNYNSRGNGVVDRVVGILKKALQKVNRNESVENVLYGYRRRLALNGENPLEILDGVKPSFAIESPDATLGKKL